MCSSFPKITFVDVICFMYRNNSKFWTPYLLTILVLKFETINSVTSLRVQGIAVCMVNSVDPDQTPHSATSDPGLLCKDLSVAVLSVITVNLIRAWNGCCRDNCKTSSHYNKVWLKYLWNYGNLF